MFGSMVKTDGSPAQFFIRLALGTVMFSHGAQKAFGWFGGPGYLETLKIFAGLGFSAWSTMALLVVELLGSAFLLLGFLTRIWALGIGVTITAGIFITHARFGFFMGWHGLQRGEGIDYHLLVLGMALALLARGGGMLSIDRLLDKDRRKGRIFY